MIGVTPALCVNAFFSFLPFWLQLNTNDGNMVEIIHMGCRVRLSERLPTVRLVYCAVFSESAEELLEDASELSFRFFKLPYYSRVNNFRRIRRLYPFFPSNGISLVHNSVYLALSTREYFCI